ncbi:hypothetical protein [Geobacillus jurassicus]|jgi:hypothetical protein|uniref:Uncharacterized protein n=1 Tax=Geobacillus jurassicus TaxID=235932 RepID=A0ABV6GXU8_9BACL|nr:hypothetical protein [Geobacillus jurassicus]
MTNEHLANNDINALQPLLDVVTDEYGNYYEVVAVTHKGGKLTKVTLSNIYFETAFSRSFIEEDIVEKYKYKHIGAFLQDLVNDHIQDLKSKKRTIFSIKDLLENGTEVEFLDQTAPHPRSRSK